MQCGIRLLQRNESANLDEARLLTILPREGLRKRGRERACVYGRRPISTSSEKADRVVSRLFRTGHAAIHASPNGAYPSLLAQPNPTRQREPPQKRRKSVVTRMVNRHDQGTSSATHGTDGLDLVFPNIQVNHIGLVGLYPHQKRGFQVGQPDYIDPCILQQWQPRPCAPLRDDMALMAPRAKLDGGLADPGLCAAQGERSGNQGNPQGFSRIC